MDVTTASQDLALEEDHTIYGCHMSNKGTGQTITLFAFSAGTRGNNNHVPLLEQKYTGPRIVETTSRLVREVDL
jgi:hypothetical protein